MSLRLSEKMLCIVAVIAAVNVAAFAIGYLMYPGYVDHGESIVAAAAYKMLGGAQVYPPFDGPNFTSNVYGPYLYLANGLMLLIFGGSVAAGKLIGIVAAVSSLILTTIAVRDHGRRLMAFAVIAMIAYLLVCFPFSLWNRPDPLLLLVSALGLLIARSEVFERRKVMGWLLVGGLGGVACSLKIYGSLFLMPIAIYMAVRDRSIFSLFIMSAAGAFMALIPFALPVFSLPNYLAWFGVVAAKPTDGEMVTKALRYGVFYLIPPAVLIAQQVMNRNNMDSRAFDKNFAYTIATLAGAAGCFYLASKPGAGMYYVLPFAPLVTDMIAQACTENAHIMSKKRRVVPGIVCGVLVAVILVTSIPIQKRFFRALEWDRTTSIQNDLHAIMTQYADQTIQMGVGNSIDGYHSTIQKSELVFAGNPYTVDFGVMMETSKLGIQLSDALIATIFGCDTDIWLIPIGEAPLEITGYYGNKVVDAEFKEAFNLNYALIDHSKYFDIWICTHPKG